MTFRSESDNYWPFPGQEHLLPPSLPDLPPAKYAAGDRVESRWGGATVLAPLDWCWVDGTWMYHIRHDFADDAPPGFGHCFAEDELQPGRPKAPAVDVDEDPRPASASPQLYLF